MSIRSVFDRTRSDSWLPTSFVLYLLAFTGFAFPWLRRMNDVFPNYPYLPDEELMVWTLAWVSHAVVDPHARIFDANIYYPTPGQLTGSEHLFFFQLLFAPLYWATGNPMLATGIVTFLTYPLGALAMAALLVRLGCSRGIAWLCGLGYSVGILRIPLNFHVLQYPNVFLPLVALGAVRVRDTPGLKQGAFLFVTLLAALLTSYYIAVVAFVTLGLWMLAEVLASRQRMLAFACAIGASALAAVLVAGLLLRPYIERSRGMVPPLLPWEPQGGLWGSGWLAFTYWRINGTLWPIVFAALAIVGVRGRGGRAWRSMTVPGIVLVSLGAILLVVGLPGPVGQLAAHTPLRNFRGWVRLLLVTEFGLFLLAAAGLDTCRRLFGVRIALLPIAAFALLIVVPRLAKLAGGSASWPAAVGERADAYRRVKRYAEELGSGPMLELPAGGILDRDAMLGSMYHWLPLINGSTGYAPPHERALTAAISALPDDAALQELVDMTHLRWILLRPDKDWGRSPVLQRLREGFAESGSIGRSFTFDGFTLLEVTATPRRAGWYSAIAEGPHPGRTALGTPIRALSPDEAVAAISPVDSIRDIPALRTLPVHLRVHNAGTADWPVLGSLPGHESGEFGLFDPLNVHLEASWVPLEQTGVAKQQPAVQMILLDRDVPAGESIVEAFAVPKPSVPGQYRLDVRVVQAGGSQFAEPPSQMLHEVIDIKAGPTRPARSETNEVGAPGGA